VVLATGAQRERRLGIPGEDLPHVVGSLSITGLMNAHPDHAAMELPRGVREVVIVGAGNVALDVARVLAKTPEEFTGSDFDPALAEAIAAWPLQRIHIVARRGAGETRFSPLELSEFGKLARARPVVDPTDVPPEDSKILALFRQFAAETAEKPVEILFHFNRQLRSIDSEGVTLTTGERLRADLVVTAIGQEAGDLCGLALAGGHLANENGRVAPGLYCVGWAKRGGTGVIGTNRNESQDVADGLLAEVQPANKGGAACLAALVAERGVNPWSFDDWQKLDVAEKAAAPPQRVRRKFWREEELETARGTE
jgi:ferredoxin--NADP+ reductase